MLEKNLLLINRDYRNIIEKRKKKISADVEKELS